MAQGKIVYNSNTLTLPIAGYEVTLNQEANDNFSAAGVHEAIAIREWDEITIQFNNISKADSYDLYAWWSYVRLGNSFTLAIDGDEDETTTLDDSAAAAQKVVPLTSTTGFAVGDYCIIKEADGDNYEIVQIASISAGVSITTEENLINTYASGDTFRHAHYWPSVIVKDKKLPFSTDGPDEFFSFSITVSETK